jgi:hypothetical protein
MPPIALPIGASEKRTPLYSGTLRHGSTISRVSAVSAHEYHLHLICISSTHVHVHPDSNINLFADDIQNH